MEVKVEYATLSRRNVLATWRQRVVVAQKLAIVMTEMILRRTERKGGHFAGRQIFYCDGS